MYFCNSAAETGQGNEEMLRFAPDSPWALIYDMETLFPDKKQQQQEQTPAKEENVSYVILHNDIHRRITKKNLLDENQL